MIDTTPTRLVNLTGRDITLLADDGSASILPSAGKLRTAPRERRIATIDLDDGATVAVAVVDDYGLDTLPPPAPGVIYVASERASGAAVTAGRRDVLTPGEFERDAAGRIVAARQLKLNNRPN